jgi:tetratricopeptide (TPR) repeat protein
MDDRLKQLLILGKEHYERNEHDRAEQVFREILEADEGAGRFADVHNMLGVILHARGDIAGAAARFEQATSINPRYTEALLSLAVTYNDLGRYEDAQALYARIRELKGADGELDPFARGKIANMHAAVAQAYADAGRPEQAIAELRKAVELCPTFADLQTKLGTLYRENGDLAMAREHYAAACTANPRYVPARVLLGVTLLALGQPDDAMAEWRSVLAIEPTNKKAQMHLRMAEALRHAAERDPVPSVRSVRSVRSGLPSAFAPSSRDDDDDDDEREEPTMVIERPSMPPNSER